MDKFFKRVVPVTIGALMATSPLLVSADTPSNNMPMLQDVSTKTARGNFGTMTASDNPILNGNGFSLTGEALIWHMYNSNSEYALANSNVTTGTAQAVGSPYKQQFAWDWGFRTGIGYYLGHDHWDTNLELTWFHTHSINSVSVATGVNFLIPLVGNPATLAPASGTPIFLNASAKNNTTYYDLMWQLGRDFFVSKYLALRPFVGVRGTWFYETRNVKYTTGAGVAYNVFDKNNFSGVGPATGLTAKMYMSDHFSIYGSALGSLIWGEFDVASTSKNITTSANIDNVTSGTRGIVPNLQFGLGLGYDTNCMDDKMNFSISAGYESLFFFGENQMLTWAGGKLANNSTTSPLNGNKEMHGFNLNVVFAF